MLYLGMFCIFELDYILCMSLFPILWQLKLHDISIEEEDSISSPEFLMEIMEINEQLEIAANLQAIQDIETGIKCELLLYISSRGGYWYITYLYCYF